MSLPPGTRLGRYVIDAPLGSGGMGDVYRASDDRLARHVAVKVIAASIADDPSRQQRFEREARAIAALNHPHICAIHDIGQHDGITFIVMELLEGESLASRLERGPLPAPEALAIGATVLETLAAVHERGLVHRDLKPANIFLTRHGPKLLDFGLARSAGLDALDAALTQPGLVLGTPRYMAPEQLRGAAADERSDLFSAAAVIYEMLAGHPAFDGTTAVDVVHAIAYEDPPVLPDATVAPAVDQVLRRALRKEPSHRYENATAFVVALRNADGSAVTTGVAPAPATRPVTRLIVLPFRLLRPDPETDFLAFSLADAVAASLATLDSLVVRSTLAAAAGDAASDLRALAAQAAVDAAVTGTLLRVGKEVRVSAQLIEVPHGSVAWSHTIQAPVDDLFQLQDALTHSIVSSLHVPLTAREHRALRRDVPASASAYELYLRGNQLMMDSSRWLDVRALYEQALALDPGYAPAWARLGRVLRVMAKYGLSDAEGNRQRAERAFERALALNPDLAMAHHLYAHLEAEIGRASDAMVRLLVRARAWQSDPDLFAGLTTVCRYCGLLDESIAAYERARRIDPSAPTSVAYTHYMRGDYAGAIATDIGSPPFAAIIARLRGSPEERARAVDQCRVLERSVAHAGVQLVTASYRLAVTGPRDELVRTVAQLESQSGFTDPEGLYLLAGFLALGGIHEGALRLLERAVGGGFHCPAAMRADEHWHVVRSSTVFERLLATAEAGTVRARDAFLRAGGPAVLFGGPTPGTGS